MVVQAGTIYSDGIINVSSYEIASLYYSIEECSNQTKQECIAITTTADEHLVLHNYTQYQDSFSSTSSDSYPPGANEELIFFIDKMNDPTFDRNLYKDKLQQVSLDYFGPFKIATVNYSWGYIVIQQDLNTWNKKNYNYLLEYSVYDPNDMNTNATFITSVENQALLVLPNNTFYTKDAKLTWKVKTLQTWPLSSMDIQVGTILWQNNNDTKTETSVSTGLIVGITIPLVILYSVFFYFVYQKCRVYYFETKGYSKMPI